MPCSNDRHAARGGDNFIFRPENEGKLKRLPIIQTEILANCIRLLKPGGSLVYSTCSLSPMENEDVVVGAIVKAHQKHGISVAVR